jgi:GNAT superfamily N-acetyltransferase
MALVNTVFEASAPVQRPMERALPLFFAEENMQQWAIAVRGGELVSAVGAHRFEMRSGQCILGAAHIGAVCTAPEWRGQGLASRLLNLECSLLRSQGVDVAFISGGRNLYRRAGAADLPGIAHRFTLPALASEMTLRPLNVETMGEAARLWALEPVTTVRTCETWSKGLGAIPDRAGWQRAQALVGEPARAYVVLDYQSHGRAEVSELAGARPSAVAAARHLAARLGCTDVSLPVPAWDASLLGYLGVEKTTHARVGDWPSEAQGSTYLLLDPTDGAGGFRTPVPVEPVQRAGVFVHPGEAV